MFGRTPKEPVTIELPEGVSAETAQFVAGDLSLKDKSWSSQSILVDANNVNEAQYRLSEAAHMSKKGTR